MPSLSCTVENCAHNKNRQCCLSNIQVGGRTAEVTDETCCDSFAPQSAKNVQGTVIENPHVTVSCEATKCRYNDNCECHADCIDICGEPDCCDCRSTECATFSCCR